jgi:hypothetical protein
LRDADKSIMATKPGGAASREPHTWRVRRVGLRSRLASKGWGIRSAYAEKTIAGRSITVTTVGEYADWVLCRFERRQS